MKTYRLFLTDKAIEDLDDIWDYASQHDPEEADRLIDRLHEKCLLLTQMPERGMLRNDIGQGIRRIIEGKHTIFYKVHSKRVDVIRILRSTRDFSRHWS